MKQKNSFDVLVIGTGAAGLYSALCLPQHYKIGLITKDTLVKSASDWAQGGIAAAVSPQDSPQLHTEDTLKAGAGLCDEAAVEFLAQQAPKSIQSLVNLGVNFDRHRGELALTLEAAHSRNRVLHAADTTGRAVVSTLIDAVLGRSNIKILEQTFALELWLDEITKGCKGVSTAHQGQIDWLQARAVVLACGGGGQVFAQTTNPSVNTGDGVAMAWRAGAILRDLEFIQFHPTALTIPGAPRFLISEAVRGEGAHLVDEQGYRFAFEYHPAGELAPRDIVSRAIFSHLQRRQSDSLNNVWLDLRSIPRERIQHRFPNIIQVCKQWGIDVFTQPIPVAPAAHYWMGGIATNLKTQTSIANLYAVGETASTGVHGANRLASNSLLECIVFGAQLAELELGEPVEAKTDQQAVEYTCNDWEYQQTKINSIRQKLPRLVWQSAGICREQKTLATALEQIQTWQQEFAQLGISKFCQNLNAGVPAQVVLPQREYLRTWGETENLLDIAYLILTSAQLRTESRGGHYRTDYPQLDPDWQTHTLVQNHCRWKAPHTT